ncbi:MAG: ATP synthase subunit C [Chromatiaceae bacterium]|jgi:V/A-type H+/Na+-transporting ATPase subunit K
MYWLVGLMSLAILGLIISGIVLDLRPALAPRLRPWFRPAMATQLLMFVGAQIGLLLLGISDAMAQPEALTTAVPEISTGMGLAILGVGIPTGLSTIGAGIAVGPIGAASLAAVMERPEALGRTLIFLGLAEGIAIYGLVMSILLLNKI